MVGCVLSQLKRSELYMLSCGKGRGWDNLLFMPAYIFVLIVTFLVILHVACTRTSELILYFYYVRLEIKLILSCIILYSHATEILATM